MGDSFFPQQPEPFGNATQLTEANNYGLDFALEGVEETEEGPVILDSVQFADNFYSDLEAKHKNPEAHRASSFGIPEMDANFGGFADGDYIVCGAAEKVGKTTLSLAVMLAQALEHKISDLGVTLDDRRHRPMWVGPEMTTMDMAAKVYAYFVQDEIDIDMLTFRDLKLRSDHWTEMQRIRELLKTTQTYWTSDMTYIEDVLFNATVRRVDRLFIDGIALMSSRRFAKVVQFDQTREVRYISRLLRLWCTRGSYPRAVWANSQLTRELNKSGKYDSPHGFWGAPLEQDATRVLMMSEITDGVEPVPAARKLKCLRARGAGAGAEFLLGFNGARSRITATTYKVCRLDDLVEQPWTGKPWQMPEPRGKKKGSREKNISLDGIQPLGGAEDKRTIGF